MAASPTDAWAGHAGDIAAWQDGAWQFSTPQIGWTAFAIDEGTLLVWNGSAWGDFFATVTAIQNLALLGVGTAADAANPFSAKLNAALWTAKTAAEGGDGELRYTLNKESAANTLSLLFQDNFSGRAEIGLTGDDNLHVKVSADGAVWNEALTIDRTTGHAGIGTSTPHAHLSLGNDISGQKLLIYDSANNRYGFGLESGVLRRFIGSTGSAHTWGTMSTADGSTYSELMRLTVDGKLGIGTDSPIDVLDVNGNVVPHTDNTRSLGTGTQRWSQVFAATGTINTSDAREKTDARDCELGLDFIRRLRPKSYRWTGGRRRHYGLIAQEVKRTLDEVGASDFAGWVLSDPADPNSLQGLRYDQMIAPLIKAVQQQQQTIDSLRSRLDTLQAR